MPSFGVRLDDTAVAAALLALTTKKRAARYSSEFDYAEIVRATRVSLGYAKK